MEEDARTLIHQRSYYIDSRSRGLAPRPQADPAHGTTESEVVHFDFLCLGKSEVSRRSHELDGYAYVLVLLQDVSGYIWLAPAKSCSARFTSRQLVPWCATFGASRSWASDNGTHFRSRVVR